MVMMYQYTRRIIGFSVNAGNVDGPAICRMFNQATSTACTGIGADHCGYYLDKSRKTADQ